MLVMLMMMMAALGSTMATVYQVGDSSGWTFNYNYNEWTFFKQFEAGDTLVFNYDPQLHNVMQVDINDYNSCTASNPLATFNSGSDSIILRLLLLVWHSWSLCIWTQISHQIKVSATTPPTTTNNRYPDH
ncbi:hypothetical protein MTR67_035431 [Solanum verrucosum]|uniref:Phytocyanin domain-containing protein n=1 Tax=Solanum verrucosum TaxID=315347 RepID=A0AAF0ZJV4_SOLVR|nr:hypothetical protein MTR67_035431 [Solanum verrucosum]